MKQEKLEPEAKEEIRQDFPGRFLELTPNAQPTCLWVDGVLFHLQARRARDGRIDLLVSTPVLEPKTRLWIAPIDHRNVAITSEELP